MALNIKSAEEAAPRARRNARPVEEIPEVVAAPQAARAPARAAGRTEAVGRDGAILRRKHGGSGDLHNKFYVPAELKEPGWDYEWKVHDVTGQIQHHELTNYAANGFTPVQSKELVERFMPRGHTGSIILDGLILMERPTALGDEARREDRIRANNQMRDQQRHLSLKRQGVLGEGFEQDERYANTMPNVKGHYAPDTEAPRPQYQIADGD